MNDSTQTMVFLLVLILLFELLPANTARSLSSDADMDENPEKGLEIMNSIMKGTMISSKVLVV